MTPEQNAALEELFTRYGYPSEDGDFRINAYFQRPDKIDSLDKIVRDDKYTCNIISQLQDKIQQLTAYRAALAERYNYLATAPTVPVVRLKRERRDKVYYILSVYDRNLLDSHEVLKSSIRYSGTERHTAINAFNTYVKQHPGIIAEMDIEKARWEK